MLTLIRNAIMRIFFSVLLLGLATYYAANINGEHGWQDDGSLYVRHAQNLLAGRDYADVLHTATPRAGVFQRTYPPGLPLLLAPVLYFRGVDFRAFKAEMYAIFFVVLALIPVAFGHRLPFSWLMVMVVLIALNPNILNVVNHITANVLCLVLYMLFAIVVERSNPHSWKWGAVAGGIAAMAFITASIGAATIVGLVVYSLFRYRRATQFLIAAVVSSAVIVLVMRSYLSVEGNYLGLLHQHLSYRMVRRNVIQYPIAVATLFAENWLMAILTVLCVVAGIVRSLRKGTTIWECVAIVHMAILYLWPFSDPFRFMMPILPLIVVYSLTGFRFFITLLEPRTAYALGTTAAVLLAVSYVQRHRSLYFEPPHDGIFRPTSQELWKYIREHTPPHATIICWKSRTVALLTGRHAVEYAWLDPRAEDWTDLCTVHPEYILTAPSLFESDRTGLQPAIDSAREKVNINFSNADFRLYAVMPGACNR